MISNFILYSKPDCPNCLVLKNKLTSSGVPFSIIELNFGQDSENPIIEIADFKAQFPGVSQMPFFTATVDGKDTKGGIREAMKFV